MGWAPGQLVDVPSPQIAGALMDLHGVQAREKARDNLLAEAVGALVDLRTMVADALGFDVKGDQQAGPVRVRGRTVEEYRAGQGAHTQARSAESYLERRKEVTDGSTS